MAFVTNFFYLCASLSLRLYELRSCFISVLRMKMIKNDIEVFILHFAIWKTSYLKFMLIHSKRNWWCKSTLICSDCLNLSMAFTKIFLHIEIYSFSSLLFFPKEWRQEEVFFLFNLFISSSSSEAAHIKTDASLCCALGTLSSFGAGIC